MNYEPSLAIFFVTILLLQKKSFVVLLVVARQKIPSLYTTEKQAIRQMGTIDITISKVFPCISVRDFVLF